MFDPVAFGGTIVANAARPEIGRHGRTDDFTCTCDGIKRNTNEQTPTNMSKLYALLVMPIAATLDESTDPMFLLAILWTSTDDSSAGNPLAAALDRAHQC